MLTPVVPPSSTEAELPTLVALIIFGLFTALMLLGVPVILALGIGCLAGLWYAGFASNLDTLYVFPQQILEGIDAPALLAIPFFVLAGNLMNMIGVTEKIFRFANALVGHLRAGLAQVNVIGSLFFGGITGSAVADCAGIGNLIIREMRKRGYPARFRLRADGRILGHRTDHVAVGAAA